MKTVTSTAALACIIFGISNALIAPTATGTTPPSVVCPDFLCNGKYNGNHEYPYDKHYFLQCNDGQANCQACWPLSLEFSEPCNQCLYNRKDECVTTQPWEPATTFECPDECPNRGYDFNGNIEDPNNRRQYIGCWQGVTVGCVACPGDLEFSEYENACLFVGKYLTKPSGDSKPEHHF
uniref:Uncharacterized protein n=1 Tax=Clytia hemisphaerica TaxID=252671 RepID=A0A7M5X207_9CNID